MNRAVFPKSVPISGRVRVCLELLRASGVKGKTVVDIGCSFGWLEKTIAGWGAKKLVGIDSNQEAIEFAKLDVRGAKFLAADALEIPLPDRYADIFVLFDVIEHVQRGREIDLLGQANRVLKDDGILLLSTPHQHLLSNLLDVAWYFGHRHYSKGTINQILDQAGFKINKIMLRGSAISSLYLSWFYIAKRIFHTPQPRSKFWEKLDDMGYKSGGITDIFLIAHKKRRVATD